MATDTTLQKNTTLRKNNEEFLIAREAAALKQEHTLAEQKTFLKERKEEMAILREQADSQAEQQAYANEVNAEIDAEKQARDEETLQTAAENMIHEEKDKLEAPIPTSSCRYERPIDEQKTTEAIKQDMTQVSQQSPGLFSNTTDLKIQFFEDRVEADLNGLKMTLKNNENGQGSTFSFTPNSDKQMIQQSMNAGLGQAALTQRTTDAAKGFNFQATQSIETLRASPKDRKDLSTYAAVVAGTDMGMDVSLNGKRLDTKELKEMRQDLTQTVQKEKVLTQLLTNRPALRPTPQAHPNTSATSPQVAAQVAQTPNATPAPTPGAKTTPTAQNNDVAPQLSSGPVTKMREAVGVVALANDATRLASPKAAEDKTVAPTTPSVK